MNIPGVDRITDTSARLTVSSGYEDGKQLRHKKTVNIPKKIQGNPERVRDWLIAERAKFADQVQRGEVGNRTLTVERWAKIWLEEYIKPNRKTGTYDGHEGNIRLHILPELGKVKLENLTPMKIKHFANKVATKTNGRGGQLSPVMVGNIRRTLSAMLETAVKQELMPSNPAKKVEWPSEERREGKALTPEEYACLIAEIEQEPLLWRALFTLLASTGMRRGEAVGLDWANVDLEQGKVSITQAAVTTAHGVEIGTPKTKAGIRTNFIPPDLCALLRKLKTEQQKLYLLLGNGWNESDPVFANETTCQRVHPDSVSTRFMKICKRAGIEGMRLHDMRHSFVSAAIHEGAAVTEIARQVGHASTDVTTRIYAHAFGDELETSRRISELVQSAYRSAK